MLLAECPAAGGNVLTLGMQSVCEQKCQQKRQNQEDHRCLFAHTNTYKSFKSKIGPRPRDNVLKLFFKALNS